MIAIVDYGVGNIFSIQSSLQFLGIKSCVTASPEVLHSAQSIILPGVGAYGDAIAKLRATGLDQVLIAESKLDKPILGICLGMQLLFEVGYEFGSHPGLGILPGEVCDLSPQVGSLKVPHMGWNQLNVHQKDALSEGINENDWVYYVHSFYVKCALNLVHSSSNYGIDVPGIVRKDKVIGMQFHPEKSGSVGLQLLKNFAKL